MPPAAYAGHAVLSELFPQQQSNNFDGLLAKQLAPFNLTASQRSQVAYIAWKKATKYITAR